ncbi:cyclin-D3-3-like [Mangifera indica]|uniref:cyclin-D3-3-like n=1 Tax=Mangifera indica TaxID=29780 RepID=UPI001CFB46BE|nr:cyclin-D3-3-like [Mangifera indica]
MALLQQVTEEVQAPSLNMLDGLFCEEESSCLEDQTVNEFEDEKCKEEDSALSSLAVVEHDLFWEDSELSYLISKENETRAHCSDFNYDGFLVCVREEAMDWIFKVKAFFGFKALTAVLAVNYFDRFVSSFKFQRDAPWMGQLTAVTCLSLAAKVEETQVPLLLDLQVEESKYVFEAKTIQKMEILVLSTLDWRMNPVTPISFFDFIVRRLGLKTHLRWGFMSRCECLLLSVIADSRFIAYPPSVLATATMLHAIKDVEPLNHVEYQTQLMSVLKISEDEVNEYYMLILEVASSHERRHKRRNLSQYIPGSPDGVVDASFNSEDSHDSWTSSSSSVSSSPESRFKRSRVHVQQMPLPSMNMLVDELSSQH